MSINNLKQHYYNWLTSKRNSKSLKKLENDISNNRDILIVHQMGRAASMTITNTLRSMDLPFPTYHTHWLNKDTVIERINSVKQGNPPLNVRVSSLISPELYNNPDSRNWKFISIIREPVARNISAFFLSAHLFIPDFFEQWEKGRLTLNEILDVFLSDFPHHLPLTWFDEEVRKPIGMDFYESPFDQLSGFSILEKGNKSFLVLKLEKLQDCYQSAFQEFLNKTPPQLVNTHITEKEDIHSELYKEFLKKITLPETYLDEMYSSKYAEHFYSENEIKQFRKKWTIN